MQFVLIIFGALLQLFLCCGRAFFMIYVSFFWLVVARETTILATQSDKESNILLRG